MNITNYERLMKPIIPRPSKVQKKLYVSKTDRFQKERSFGKRMFVLKN